MSTVGELIRDERERAGICLRMLAAKLGMSVVDLGRIERNKQAITEAERDAILVVIRATEGVMP